MSGEPSTEQPHEAPARAPRRGSENTIFWRMYALDKERRGCFAAIDTIRRAVNPNEWTYSYSHTRRLIRRLRENGHILFAGQTANSRNVYLLPERVFPHGKDPRPKYKAADLPICTSRPVEHLFPTDAAKTLIEEGTVPKAVGFLVENYPVSRKLAADFSEEVIREAVAIINETYKGQFDRIRSKPGLLRSICEKVVDRRRPAAAERRSEARREASQARFDEQSPEHRAQLAALLARGRLGAGDSSPTAPDAEESPPTAPKAAPPALPGSLAAFLDEWLRFVSPQLRPETRGQYGEKLKQVKRLLGDIEPRELRRQHFVQYIEQRRADGVKEQTINQELARLRQALREAEKRGLCKGAVRDAIPRLRTLDKRKARPLSVEDYQALRHALRGHPKRQAYLDLGVYTGARRSELEGLTRADVDFKKNRIHIRGTKTKGADRYVPLRPELAELARKHPGGKLVGPWLNAPGDLAEACEAAGIERRTVLDLRHTFASWLKQRGVDSLTVAKLMGHRDGKMVEQVYAHLDDATLRRAMEQLPARAGPEARPPPAAPESDSHPTN